MAWEPNNLKFHNSTILVFPDLPAEVLFIWHTLKPVLQMLQEVELSINGHNQGSCRSIIIVRLILLKTLKAGVLCCRLWIWNLPLNCYERQSRGNCSFLHFPSNEAVFLANCIKFYISIFWLILTIEWYEIWMGLNIICI